MAKVNGKGSISENDMFLFPVGEDIDSDDIQGFVKYNQQVLLKNYDENIGMYKGHYPILDQEDKPLNKPDNRILVNFAKYITDIFNGFFIGVPPKISLPDDSSNDDLQTFNNRTSMFDKLSEIAKQTSIYGRSFLMLYQDENSNTNCAISSPKNSLMVYDDTVAHRPMFFIRYSVDEDNNLTGTVYTPNEQRTFDSDFDITGTTSHLFKAVPAIEFIENEERQSVFESVKPIMNAINSALSQKANNVEAIADAYLLFKGGEFDSDMIKNMADNRVIANSSADADAKFLERPTGDGTQENLLDRLAEYLFQTAMVTNLNDVNTTGSADTASGYSIELKMQAMRSLASNKERKFTNALREFYRIVFNISNVAKTSLVKKVVNTLTGNAQSNPADELSFQFTRNLPRNVANEATTAQTLEGVVSKETQLKVLSIVDDPKAEIQKIQDEEKDGITSAVNSNPANYNFDDEKKSGVEDDETDSE
jgi:SPP1 family phage portal protein